MESAIRIGQRRRPEAAVDPLVVALALYREGGLTEVEALFALHVRVLGKATALGVRLEGARE